MHLATCYLCTWLLCICAQLCEFLHTIMPYAFGQNDKHDCTHMYSKELYCICIIEGLELNKLAKIHLDIDAVDLLPCTVLLPRIPAPLDAVQRHITTVHCIPEAISSKKCLVSWTRPNPSAGHFIRCITRGLVTTSLVNQTDSRLGHYPSACYATHKVAGGQVGSGSRV